MNTRILLSFLLLVSIENFAATIILLNGNSSAGKTTIAQELQKLSDNPLLWTGIDHFLDMILRERYDENGSKAHEGWKFDVLTDADNKTVKAVNPICNFHKCVLSYFLESGVFFWRDTTGHEIDCIIEKSNDRLVPIEIKASQIVKSNRVIGRGCKLEKYG